MHQNILTEIKKIILLPNEINLQINWCHLYRDICRTKSEIKEQLVPTGASQWLSAEEAAGKHALGVRNKYVTNYIRPIGTLYLQVRKSLAFLCRFRNSWRGGGGRYLIACASAS